MKLIDLILQEVNLGGLSSSIKYLAQDENKSIWGFIEKPTFRVGVDGGFWHLGCAGNRMSEIKLDIKEPILSDDYSTEIIDVETFYNLPSKPVEPENLIDDVNHPSHYTIGKIECIDIIEEMVRDKSGMEAACIANVVKYLYRYKGKGGLESVRKAQWYLNKMIEVMGNE